MLVTCLLRILLLFIMIGIKLEGMHIGVITQIGFVGDREIAWRIKIAAERLGWEVSLNEESGGTLNEEPLDFTICMLPNNECFNPSCPNYLLVFHPFWYLNEERKLMPHYMRYDGYLLTIPDRETLEVGLKENNKKFYHVPFYPSVYQVPHRINKFNFLTVMIPVWGNRKEDEKFRTLYSMICRTGIAKFYGVDRNEDIIPNNYMGPIPYDGKSVIDVLQKNGIVLVLHSDIHNSEQIPSGRIFEAAAASAVIISDENGFVKKHFGNSVFYIDTSRTAEEIFDQIQQHLKTIQSKPQKVARMAKNANKIFNSKFRMEKQLLNLKKMHEQLLKDRML